MKHFNSFRFIDYFFDHETKQLDLHYGYDDVLRFTESYVFNVPLADSIDDSQLDRAFQTLFFMAGVSYYKLYLARHIEVETGQLDSGSAAFFSRTYQKGLGEFFYVNQLDPRTTIDFPITEQGPTTVPTTHLPDGQLIAIGGGKDSLVCVDILRSQQNIKTWHLGHSTQLNPLTQRIGLPNFGVMRRLDPSLLNNSLRDAYSGHIPISAIFAAAGIVLAVLTNTRDVVVANENSANEATLTYSGVSINHQYSKSLSFEQDFQTHLLHRFDKSVRYYSALRPLSELHIAKLFGRIIDDYQDVFSSCNRAFAQHSDHLFWCGECAKCAFTFLILTPFVKRLKLEAMWGKNLLLDPSLETTYEQLLGIAGDKPLDCVGEVQESRTAMRMAQAIYPQLSRYKFDLRDNYDWMLLREHAMPEKTFKLLKEYINHK